jgi:hypothetical protein
MFFQLAISISITKNNNFFTVVHPKRLNTRSLIDAFKTHLPIERNNSNVWNCIESFSQRPLFLHIYKKTSIEYVYEIQHKQLHQWRRRRFQVETLRAATCVDWTSRRVAQRQTNRQNQQPKQSETLLATVV